MDDFETPENQAQATKEAMEESGLTINAVWIRYFSFTGAAGEWEVDAYLNGSLTLPVEERNLISHAVNELIKELPPRRMAPYFTKNDEEPSHGGEPPHANA